MPLALEGRNEGVSGVECPNCCHQCSVAGSVDQHFGVVTRGLVLTTDPRSLGSFRRNHSR